MVLDIRYNGKKTRIIAGNLTSSGNIPGLTTLQVTGISFWSSGGGSTITGDIITGTITLANGMSFAQELPIEKKNPIFTVVLGGGATFYYTITTIE